MMDASTYRGMGEQTLLTFLQSLQKRFDDCKYPEAAEAIYREYMVVYAELLRRGLTDNDLTLLLNNKKIKPVDS